LLVYSLAKILANLLAPPRLTSSIKRPVQEETWNVARAAPVIITKMIDMVIVIIIKIQKLKNKESLAKIRAANKNGIDKIKNSKITPIPTKKFITKSKKAISRLTNQFFINSCQPI
jgi:hypothetical protein